MSAKELLALLLIVALYGIASEQDFQDDQLAHGAVQVAQK